MQLNDAPHLGSANMEQSGTPDICYSRSDTPENSAPKAFRGTVCLLFFVDYFCPISQQNRHFPKIGNDGFGVYGTQYDIMDYLYDSSSSCSAI